MKKLILALSLLMSPPSFADGTLCKAVYTNHFARLNLIQGLFMRGEISEEFQKARLMDEITIMEISIPVLCKGISKRERQSLKVQALIDCAKQGITVPFLN